MRVHGWRVPLAVAAVLAVGLIASPLPATASSSTNCNSPALADANGKNVVLAIHGWNGSPLTDTVATLLKKLDPAKWKVVTYSYLGELSDEWPDKSGAAECLRQVIRTVHASAGGEKANVYIVAHSMGGIVTRFALDPSRDAEVGKFVGGVVTLDTPHNGSPLGATAWSWLTNHSGDGWRCLALHHPGSLPSDCAYPPYLPAGVPLAQVAGDATITRNFFMFGYSNLDTNSDGIVWTKSSSGYATSADGSPPAADISTIPVACQTGAGNLMPMLAEWAGSIVNPLGLYGLLGSKQVADGDPLLATNTVAAATLGAVSTTAPCGHNNIASDSAALTATVQRLQAWADQNQNKIALPTGGTWFYDLMQDVHPSTSGEQEVATLPTADGGTAQYPNSTNQWVGCDGTVDKLNYELEQKYSHAKLTFGVQAHAPDGLEVKFTVLTKNDRDWLFGDPVVERGTYTVTRGEAPLTINLDVTGVYRVFIEASTTGSCGPADTGYASLVQSYVY